MDKLSDNDVLMLWQAAGLNAGSKSASIYQKEIFAALSELIDLRAKHAKPSNIEGHDQPCYYCKEPCNGFAGNPSLWPIPLSHNDEPGKAKWHHVGCVSERLQRYQEYLDSQSIPPIGGVM